jgi:MFS family permease
LFFAGQSVSLVGSWMQRIALPWLVYDITGSVVLLGAFSFASQIPILLLTSVAGVYADRWNKQKALIILQGLAMIQALVLFVLSKSGIIEIWHIVVLGVLLGCIHAFDVPIRQSFVPQMVTKKKDLSNAIALNSSMVNIGKLVGPSLAGIIIATAGIDICFLINAFSYLVVMLTIHAMNLGQTKIIDKSKKIFQELSAGFRYTIENNTLRNVILLLSLSSLFCMPYMVLLPVFVKDVFDAGAKSYGMLMSASGLGALAGAVFLASRRTSKGLELIIPVFSIIMSVSLILFSLSSNLVVSVIILFFTGLGMMVQITSSNTLIQSIVSENMRGRVMGIYSMAFLGISPFGSILAGWLADYIGVGATVCIGAVFSIVGTLFYIKRVVRW